MIICPNHSSWGTACPCACHAAQTRGVYAECSDLWRGLVKPEYLYESAALKNIEIHEEIAAGVDVHASRENLIQLISILFDNAVKYASEGGYIDGSLKKSGRELVLQVKNTCEKLPEVEPEKLFERFYRGDAARTQKSGGYGIGLSAARAIALARGGTLGASYEKDDIICFTLRLKEP